MPSSPGLSGTSSSFRLVRVLKTLIDDALTASSRLLRPMDEVTLAVRRLTPAHFAETARTAEHERTWASCCSRLDDIEDLLEIVLDLVLAALPGQRELLDQQRARGVEHLPLAEGEVLVALEEVEIAQNLSDLEHRAGLDLLHVLTVAAIPGRGVNRDVLFTEYRVDLLDVLLADDLAQPDGADFVDGDHDPHPVLENAEHIERLALAGYLGVLDSHHLTHALSRVDCLVTRLEAGLHAYCLLWAFSRFPGLKS